MDSEFTSLEKTNISYTVKPLIRPLIAKADYGLYSVVDLIPKQNATGLQALFNLYVVLNSGWL